MKTSKKKTPALESPADLPETAPASEPTPALVEAEQAQSAPAESGEKFGWLKRLNAQRAIDHALSSLAKHDFASFGVDLTAAVETLKAGSTAMHALNTSKPSAARIEVGSVVRLRSKAVPSFEGVIEANDSIKVLAVAKGSLKGELGDGTKVALPRSVVELAAT